MKTPLFFAACCLALFFGFPEAKAVQPPLGVFDAVAADSQPIASLANLTMDCDAAEKAVRLVVNGADYPYTRVYCENLSATPVFYGAKGVGNAAPTPCIGLPASNCAGTWFDYHIGTGLLFCRGDVNLGCHVGR